MPKYNVHATRKRIQTNASGRGGDKIFIEIKDYPSFIQIILVQMESKGSDWEVIKTFGEFDEIKDFSFNISSVAKGLKDHEDINIMIIDKRGVGKQFRF